MYKICFYIPESHMDKAKRALFEAGAGRFRNYDSCSWEIEGTGQFRALDGSNPFLGQKNEIEKIREFRVEMICEDQTVKKVLKALIEVHPYEEPAYDVTKIYTLSDFDV